MKTYKITVSYDGTAYSGWQFQQHKTAIINILQEQFKKLFNQEIKLLGSSRTDAGVHAIGQVARFSCDITIDPSRMMFAWNNALPNDILIRDLMVVDDEFNPRNVIKKIYYYHFFVSKPLPFIARYGWHITQPVDIKKLQQSLQVFVGTHDFRSFCTGYDKENTIRIVDSISLVYVKRFGCTYI